MEGLETGMYRKLLMSSPAMHTVRYSSHQLIHLLPLKFSKFRDTFVLLQYITVSELNIPFV